MATPRLVPSGRTAAAFILVGWIFQLVEVALLLLLASFLLYIPFLGILFAIFATFGALWVALVYFLSYRPATEGRYASASTPTLIFGILSIFSVSWISAILYLIAYAKLNDAESEAAAPPPGWGYPPQGWRPPPLQPAAPGSPLNMGVKYCPACGRQNDTGARFCQGCGVAQS